MSQTEHVKTKATLPNDYQNCYVIQNLTLQEEKDSHITVV